MEIVQQVPPPLPRVENNNSAIIPSILPFPDHEIQEIQDRIRIVSTQDASRIIFGRRIKTTSRFTVLSSAGEDRFLAREVNSTDTASMVDALQAPQTLALACNPGKRLKLAAPVTILEAARAQSLNTALVVSKQSAREVIRQLENFEENSEQNSEHNSEQNSEESDEERLHKEPQPSLTLQEIIDRKGKPFQIEILVDND